MIAAPAVDLRGGRCVQLEGGDPSKERVALADPIAVAESWVARGFDVLHVVDLDAALGSGNNGEVVARLAALSGVSVQVGGGIRSTEAVDDHLVTGAARVIVGTRALEDEDWLRGMAERHPGRVLLAADVRGDRVQARGWTEDSGWLLDELFRRVAELPLAGILVTDVGREGRLTGIDREWLGRVVSRTTHPIWASGGIESIDDVRAADEAGAAGAVIGMALYTGRIDPAELAEEFGRDTSEARNE